MQRPFERAFEVKDAHPIMVVAAGHGRQSLKRCAHWRAISRADVPSPARFAFHKLWLSGERNASEMAKARKDRRQAEQILDVLVEERPGDVTAAWPALGARKSMLKGARTAMRKVEPSLRERLVHFLTKNGGSWLLAFAPAVG